MRNSNQDPTSYSQERQQDDTQSSSHRKPGQYCIMVLFKARAEKRTPNFIGRTRSHAIVLYNTQPAVCIEKAVCMKTIRGALPQCMLNSKIATGCTQSEVRTAVNKINEKSTQEHLVTNPANRRVPGRPGTTPMTTEFLAYFILQSNSHRKPV